MIESDCTIFVRIVALWREHQIWKEVLISPERTYTLQDVTKIDLKLFPILLKFITLELRASRKRVDNFIELF